MKNNQIKILAIETSCDETAASLVVEKDGKPEAVSNIISSQIDLHTKTGGVVPEVASRAHIESVLPVVEEALQELSLKDVTHIAVTAGPGLIGSLMVGFDTAKSLAYGLGLPIVPINHIEGHIYSALCGENDENQMTNVKQNIKSQISNDKNKTQEAKKLTPNAWPILALTVSGGHTSLTLMEDHGKYETLGETLDDAAGEAFDKVAKLLDLGYPGGPAVSKLAEQFRNRKNKSPKTSNKQITNHKSQKNKNQCQSVKEISGGALRLKFPRPMLDRPNFDFSFSGLKTAVLVEVKKRLETKKELSDSEKEEICFAFEEAVVDVLVGKALKAAKKYKPASVILAGGVAANNRLREELKKRLSEMTNDKFQMTNKISNSKFQNKKDQCQSVELISGGGLRLLLPPKDMTGDNAAMIGLAAYYHIARGKTSSWNNIELNSNMKL